MILNTASETISFLKQLETTSAAYYENMAGKFKDLSDVFLAFAKENRKNTSNIERTYFGVITDALEGCFAFNIEPGKYVLDMPVAESRKEALGAAVLIEERMFGFYTDAAAQAKGLMADIPRVMERIARNRTERQKKIQSLISEVR